MTTPSEGSQPFDPNQPPAFAVPGEPGPADFGFPPPSAPAYPPPAFPPSPGAAEPYPAGYPGAGYPGPGYPGAGYPGPGYPGPGFPMGPGNVTPPDHPQAMTAMILGILSLICCQLLGPFAIYLGRKSMREIDASGGQYGGRGQAQAGFILGIIGSAFLVLVLLYLIFSVAFFGASMSTGRS